LCIYLTISRGALALVVGVVVFLLFVPRRLDALGTLSWPAEGRPSCFRRPSQRDALQDGVSTVTAIHQGTQLLWRP